MAGPIRGTVHHTLADLPPVSDPLETVFLATGLHLERIRPDRPVEGARRDGLMATHRRRGVAEMKNDEIRLGSPDLVMPMASRRFVCLFRFGHRCRAREAVRVRGVGWVFLGGGNGLRSDHGPSGNTCPELRIAYKVGNFPTRQASRYAEAASGAASGRARTSYILSDRT